MQNKKLELYENFLKVLFVGNDANSIICISKAGYGKTFTTIQLLEKLKIEYSYFNGVTTAVALYKMLYDNRNSVVVLDDIETLFRDDRAISIFKSALSEVSAFSNKARVVSYNTSSKVLAEYPSSFEFTGKIIVLANEVKGRRGDSFNALLSRCMVYKLVYTVTELRIIAQEIIDSKTDLTVTQKMKVMEIIDSNIRPAHEFNLRLLMRLVTFVKFDIENAESMFLNTLNTDSETDILTEILKIEPKQKNQLEMFVAQTGMDRATFFRKKKSLRELGYFQT